MFPWLIYTIWYYAAIDETFDHVYHIINTISSIFIISGYIFVLYETYKSNTMGYLRSHSKHEGGAEEFIQKLINKEPTVTTRVKAWHNEKRSATTHFVHAGTGQTIRTETRTVKKKKVYTWEGVHYFYFDYWEDLSDVNSIPKAQGDAIMRVKLTKRVILANQQTVDALKQQKKAYLKENRGRDKYQEVQSTCYNVPGFKKNLMSYYSQEPPWWMNKYIFMLSAVIWCSWPYKWIMNYHTKKAYFTVKKIISVIPIEVNKDVPTGQISQSTNLQQQQPITNPYPNPNDLQSQLKHFTAPQQMAPTNPQKMAPTNPKQIEPTINLSIFYLMMFKLHLLTSKYSLHL